MKRRVEDAPCLWVEAVKLRPTALRVLHTLAALERASLAEENGVTTHAIAQESGLTPHVVRARLCDLRRLALAASYSTPGKNAGHGLTDYGRRRLEASR